MTKIDLTKLDTIQNVSAVEFREHYRQTGQSIATDYYQELANQGALIGNDNIVNYANLASNVTLDNNFRGEFANDHANNVAGDNDIHFEVGSDNWLNMQHELMLQDFTERRDSSATGELTWRQTNEIHARAFDIVDLPPESYTLYTILDVTGKYDFDHTQSMFEETLTTGGTPVVEFFSVTQDTLSWHNI